jgi:phosphatidylserine/phosphatidylglycerophosphate/cardiolipin synthase-like enzyme
VQVILDAHAQPHHPLVAAVALLVAAGIAVFLDNRHVWAHDKVMILDGKIVITGSYNWTVAAEKSNSENLLVIRDLRLAGCIPRIGGAIRNIALCTGRRCRGGCASASYGSPSLAGVPHG